MALLSEAPIKQVPVAHVAYIWHKDHRPSPVVEMNMEGEGPRLVILDSKADASLVLRDWFEKRHVGWTDKGKYAKYYGLVMGMGENTEN
jgi:hypothetical protein